MRAHNMNHLIILKYGVALSCKGEHCSGYTRSEWSHFQWEKLGERSQPFTPTQRLPRLQHATMFMVFAAGNMGSGTHKTNFTTNKRLHGVKETQGKR